MVQNRKGVGGRHALPAEQRKKLTKIAITAPTSQQHVAILGLSTDERLQALLQAARTKPSQTGSERVHIDEPGDVIALVRIPAPTPAQLAEADRRIDRAVREGFYTSNPDGTPSDERVYINEGDAPAVPA